MNAAVRMTRIGVSWDRADRLLLPSKELLRRLSRWTDRALACTGSRVHGFASVGTSSPPGPATTRRRRGHADAIAPPLHPRNVVAARTHRGLRQLDAQFGEPLLRPCLGFGLELPAAPAPSLDRVRGPDGRPHGARGRAFGVCRSRRPGGRCPAWRTLADDCSGSGRDPYTTPAGAVSARLRRWPATSRERA